MGLSHINERWRLWLGDILISLTDNKKGLVTGMLPKRNAFGGILARDAARTEPYNYFFVAFLNFALPAVDQPVYTLVSPKLTKPLTRT